MKKLLSILFLFSSPAFAIDKPIPCTGNSCKLLFETTGSGGAKVSAGNVDGTGVLNLNFGLKPSAVSNTLTNFTEATWTPVRSFSGSNGTSSMATQEGRYTRVGSMIVFHGRITLTKGTATGALSITGLPSNATSSVSYTPVTITVDNGITYGTAARWAVQGYITAGTSTITMIFSPSNGGGAVAIDATDLATNTTLFISGVYQQ